MLNLNRINSHHVHRCALWRLSHLLDVSGHLILSCQFLLYSNMHLVRSPYNTLFSSCFNFIFKYGWILNTCHLGCFLSCFCSILAASWDEEHSSCAGPELDCILSLTCQNCATLLQSFGINHGFTIRLHLRIAFSATSSWCGWHTVRDDGSQPNLWEAADWS